MVKHILLSTQDPGVGGVAQYNNSLLRALIKLGYRVTCLQPQPFDEEVITIQEQLGIEHIFLKEDAINLLPNIFNHPDSKPDIIIFSNTSPFANFLIKKVAIQFAIPYIIVEGLVEPHLAEQYSTYLDELSYQYAQARSVIAVSGDNLNLLYKLFKLPKLRGEVIYYGRPEEYFTERDLSVCNLLRKKYNIPLEAVVCFTCARIETRKGYQYQLEAIKHLMARSVWSQIYFVWAGGGIFQPELEKELKTAVENLGISNKIIFLGQIPNVLDWLNVADIFVFPSLLEGMPLCVMEAMGKGLPVIASAVSGIPEELGGTGKLITDPKINPQATVRELVETIEEWVINPQLRQSIGQSCKHRAENMFQEERMIQETVEVIEKALLPAKDYVHPGFNGNTEMYFQKVFNFEKVYPKIIIDGVFFQLYQTGIARVWKSLLEEWVNNSFAKHIVVLDRAGTAPKIPGIRYRNIEHYDYNNTEADKQILQQICDEEGADLFISSYYTTPITTPSVFMAYDMIPEVMGWDMNNPMWREKHQAIQQASAYITISEHTAHDLVRCFPDIANEAVTVAHCGVPATFVPAKSEAINSFKTKYGISKPYFLLVGTGSGYKNSILFFRAFAKLTSSYGFDIVCTGVGTALTPEFRACTSGSVVHTLQLSDEELALAYSGAVALVYPSKYEGFGMPVAEAMACGCPVITCPNASIPEVAGEAAIYVKDDDVDGLGNALCEVQKPAVRQSLITAGLAQAQKFSWAKMADIVSSALIDATLLSLNLKEINLIIFPDWSASEESISVELAQVIRTLATHADSYKTTLLIDTTDISGENAELFLSSATMNLLMEEDLDLTDGLEISLVMNLADIQWKALLPRIHGRIILENQNQQALIQAKADTLASYPLTSFSQERDEEFFFA